MTFEVADRRNIVFITRAIDWVRVQTLPIERIDYRRWGKAVVKVNCKVCYIKHTILTCWTLNKLFCWIPESEWSLFASSVISLCNCSCIRKAYNLLACKSKALKRSCYGLFVIGYGAYFVRSGNQTWNRCICSCRNTTTRSSRRNRRCTGCIFSIDHDDVTVSADKLCNYGKLILDYEAASVACGLDCLRSFYFCCSDTVSFICIIKIIAYKFICLPWIVAVQVCSEEYFCKARSWVFNLYGICLSTDIASLIEYENDEFCRTVWNVCCMNWRIPEIACWLRTWNSFRHKVTVVSALEIERISWRTFSFFCIGIVNDLCIREVSCCVCVCRNACVWIKYNFCTRNRFDSSENTADFNQTACTDMLFVWKWRSSFKCVAVSLHFSRYSECPQVIRMCWILSEGALCEDCCWTVLTTFVINEQICLWISRAGCRCYKRIKDCLSIVFFWSIIFTNIIEDNAFKSRTVFRNFSAESKDIVLIIDGEVLCKCRWILRIWTFINLRNWRSGIINTEAVYSINCVTASFIWICYTNRIVNFFLCFIYRDKECPWNMFYSKSFWSRYSVTGESLVSCTFLAESPFLRRSIIAAWKSLVAFLYRVWIKQTFIINLNSQIPIALEVHFCLVASYCSGFCCREIWIYISCAECICSAWSKLSEGCNLCRSGRININKISCWPCTDFSIWVYGTCTDSNVVSISACRVKFAVSVKWEVPCRTCLGYRNSPPACRSSSRTKVEVRSKSVVSLYIGWRFYSIAITAIVYSADHAYSRRSFCFCSIAKWSNAICYSANLEINSLYCGFTGRNNWLTGYTDCSAKCSAWLVRVRNCRLRPVCIRIVLDCVITLDCTVSKFICRKYIEWKNENTVSNRLCISCISTRRLIRTISVINWNFTLFKFECPRWRCRFYCKSRIKPFIFSSLIKHIIIRHFSLCSSRNQPFCRSSLWTALIRRNTNDAYSSCYLIRWLRACNLDFWACCVRNKCNLSVALQARSIIRNNFQRNISLGICKWNLVSRPDFCRLAVSSTVSFFCRFKSVISTDNAFCSDSNWCTAFYCLLDIRFIFIRNFHVDSGNSTRIACRNLELYPLAFRSADYIACIYAFIFGVFTCIIVKSAVNCTWSCGICTFLVWKSIDYADFRWSWVREVDKLSCICCICQWRIIYFKFWNIEIICNRFFSLIGRVEFFSGCIFYIYIEFFLAVDIAVSCSVRLRCKSQSSCCRYISRCCWFCLCSGISAFRNINFINSVIISYGCNYLRFCTVFENIRISSCNFRDFREVYNFNHRSVWILRNLDFNKLVITGIVLDNFAVRIHIFNRRIADVACLIDGFCTDVVNDVIQRLNLSCIKILDVKCVITRKREGGHFFARFAFVIVCECYPFCTLTFRIISFCVISFLDVLNSNDCRCRKWVCVLYCTAQINDSVDFPGGSWCVSIGWKSKSYCWLNFINCDCSDVCCLWVACSGIIRRSYIDAEVSCIYVCEDFFFDRDRPLGVIVTWYNWDLRFWICSLIFFFCSSLFLDFDWGRKRLDSRSVCIAVSGRIIKCSSVKNKVSRACVCEERRRFTICQYALYGRSLNIDIDWIAVQRCWRASRCIRNSVNSRISDVIHAHKNEIVFADSEFRNRWLEVCLYIPEFISSAACVEFNRLCIFRDCREESCFLILVIIYKGFYFISIRSRWLREYFVIDILESATLFRKVTADCDCVCLSVSSRSVLSAYVFIFCSESSTSFSRIIVILADSEHRIFWSRAWVEIVQSRRCYSIEYDCNVFCRFVSGFIGYGKRSCKRRSFRSS